MAMASFDFKDWSNVCREGEGPIQQASFYLSAETVTVCGP